MSDAIENKNESQVLLKVDHLKKYFRVPGKGELHAVDDVSFQIRKGETLGLVGESGCGKSTVGNVLMRLHKETGGEAVYDGVNYLKLNEKQMKPLKQKLQMIFQDPYSSLNPKKNIRTILSVPLKLHTNLSGAELENRIVELAQMVGLEPYVLDMYPHELDGGKRQLVGIARALALEPDLIVCDEPVSSLDVSVQATIINLLIDMQKKMGLSYLFISHDLSVVRHISNRIAVMYLGQIVEMADADEIFEGTLHPYSIALLSAVPVVNTEEKMNRIVLQGDVPSPINPQPGCRFKNRCWMCSERCENVEPTLEEVKPGHFVACPFWAESRENAKKAEKTTG